MDQTTATIEHPRPAPTTVVRPRAAGAPPKVDLFGVQVTRAGFDEVLTTVMAWGRERRSAIVDFMSVHGLALSKRDAEFRRRLNEFDLVACDGQPVRWALNRWHDAQLAERVYGPAMTLALCRAAAEQGVGVYFYGARPEVLEQLTARLRERFARLNIAGAESPPFRPLSAAELEETVERINQSGAGLVFIGMGCPKQEVLATDLRGRIDGVLLCVGAAFDFHAGTLPMAPSWMQRAGLEWFYRLCREPRRLWKRYLVSNTTFVGMCLTRRRHAGVARTSVPESPEL